MSNLHDLDYYGYENSNGSPIVHYDEEAIKVALYNWLTSRKGDFVKNPNLGGVFDKALFKRMDKRTMSLLQLRIQTQLQSFVPAIELLGLSIIPDYENRLWEISIQYKSGLTAKPQALTIYTKDMSKKISLEYVEIDYLDDNLRNFCLIKQADMAGNILEFDVERDRWKWGQYLFSTSFSTSSSNFSDILTICNASS